MRVPKITVLMPVYNGERYLHESIESILTQTFTDFEFLIINDGSTDRSIDIIQTYHDPRIKLISNDKNMKLIATLNKGLKLAQGKYIARMDCDDISLPTRLEKQFLFMERNTNIGVCGSWIQLLGIGEGHIEKYPTDSDDIQASLLFYCAIAHPTVMIRTEMLRKHNLEYDSKHLHAEDYGLWKRCSTLFPLANIPEVLLKYRIWNESVSNRFVIPKIQTLKNFVVDDLKSLGLEPEKILSNIFTWFHPEQKRTKISLRAAEYYLECIYAANQTNKIFSDSAIKKAISRHWFHICYNSTYLGVWIWYQYYNSRFSSYWKPIYLQRVKFLIKSLLKYNHSINN